MTIEIDAHPVESKQESDSCSLKFTLRLQFLDVATGEPLRYACVAEPQVDNEMQKALNKRGLHPFMFAPIKKLGVHFIHVTNGIKDCDYPGGMFSCLTTFTVVPNTPPLKITLKETDTRVPEVFDALPDSQIFEGAGGSLFVPVRPLWNDPTPRYVMVKDVVKDARNVYAKRCLATNFDGILEIPIKPLEWRDLWKGTSYEVKLRDYDLLEVDEEWIPKTPIKGNVYKTPTVRLVNDPDNFQWVAQKESIFGRDSWVKFKEVITVSRPPFLLPNPRLFGSTSWIFRVWAVRRPLQAQKDGILADKFHTVQANIHARKGIIIHYNSGAYIKQKGIEGGYIDCLNFVNAEGDDCFALNTAVEFMTVYNEKWGNQTHVLGYNYHIGRDGAIVLAGSEGDRANHAGGGIEVSEVIKAILPDGTPKDNDPGKDIPDPSSVNINTSHFGIVLVGHHRESDNEEYPKGAEALLNFNPRQRWYLDRLIENLRVRFPSIHWSRIQGHQEVDTTKHDPGEALAGGMERLRGRHVDPVPLVPGKPPAV